MLEGLFGDEESGGHRHTEVHKPGIPSPPRPRYQCGLAGISNQGATCYLNSLLQTLLFTPEFRESLFDLGEQELGSLQNKNIPGQKVRIIPLQLQKLFARLLLSDQQSISTTELTDSFGWNNNEELQQHDVQELNRILFSAIEASLVGTPGKDLINQLYHGTVVNQIICCTCGKISEREEDFLDLTVTVAGNFSLVEGLRNNYVDYEMMDGKNQYKCERCQKLVNAKKGAKIRSLPEILSISLLRFSFDLQKFERYKETGKFTFPYTLDMAPFCEKIPDSSEYELFSVVIHRGGAYGGHYHAFIRDVDSLGQWTHPDEETIQLPTDPSTGEVDYIQVDSPVDLIQAILVRNPVLNIDKLCAEITKQTGVSWNKRFRKNFGPIVKFLEKNNDVFSFDPASNQVTLGGAAHHKTDEEQLPSSSNQGQSRNKRPQSPNPLPGHAWFNFDDSRVSPIREKEIEKQFEGKESAYMLFYRKKTLERPKEAEGNPAYKVPDDLITEVIIDNEDIQRQREEFEIEMNRISIQVHFSQSYQYYSGALHPIRDQCSWMELNIDRRKSMADLKIAIQELGGELVPEVFVLQKMREVPAGHHLYDFVSGDDSKQIKDVSLDTGSMVFVWNGQQVNDVPVHFGKDYEPVLLNISYGNGQVFIRGFAKCLTLEEFKDIVSEETGINVKDLRLKRMVGLDTNPKLVDFTHDLLDTTLESLKFNDGDEIMVENKLEGSSSLSSEIQNRMSTFPVYVENRCKKGDVHNSRARFEVTFDMTISEVKAMAVSKFGVFDIQDGGRLRIDHETLGLRTPLYENLTVLDASLSKGSNLVLEPGPAPSSNQMTLTFTPGDPKSDLPDLEVTVDKMTTVEQCLQCMILKAGFKDDNWHLQKTNWCGEPAEVLDDLDLTLEMSLVNHGDHLLLVKGKLPPKGFIRIPIWLYPSPRTPFSDAGNNQSGVFGWFTNQLKGLLNIGSKSDGTSSLPEEPVCVGEMEVALVMTLEEFKFQILTLPVFSDLSLPTTGFLRVRMVESGSLSTVLKGNNQTLQKLKVKSCNRLAIQILEEEEDLNVNQMVLSIKQRIPNTRDYLPCVEIIWDTSQGPTIVSLQKTLSERLFIPLEHIGLAKHFPKRYDWLVVRENHNNKQQNNKGKKKGQKINLRHGPYNIQDGDVIGVKNLQLEVERKEDYSTEDDDLGKLELKKEAEEKKKQREERKKFQDALDGSTSKSRRPEVSLTIKVDDFR